MNQIEILKSLDMLIYGIATLAVVIGAAYYLDHLIKKRKQ